MSETIKYGWLHDENGTKLAPKTVIGEVLNNDGTVFNPVTKSSQLDNDIGFTTSDTKNTTGTSDTDNGQMYLVASKDQLGESQTYTDKRFFIGENHKDLYGNGFKVRDNESEAIAVDASIYGDKAKKGTAGIAQVTIGSSRDISRDGDYIGHLYQYSKNGNYTDLVPSESLNNNPVIILPTSSGTLALTKDATKVETSSINGNISINGKQANVYTHPGGTNPHGTTKSDVGLGNVGNFKAVSTVASQGLTDAEKANACTNIGAAKKEWTFVGSGTSVDISDVYSNACEWYVCVKDANEIITDFNLPYNRFTIDNSATHVKGYYFDTNYYATIALFMSNKSINIREAWTKIQYGVGKSTNTATIYVYYR